MKNFALIIALMMIGVLSTNAQVQKQKVSVSQVKAQATTGAENYAEIKFDTLFHDFGTFSKNNPIVECTFEFTNVGTAPLVINQAFASCGCTVPTYTLDPVKPGERGVVKITYNGTDKFPGRFKKTVTIRTNSTKEEVVRLTIAGNME